MTTTASTTAVWQLWSTPSGWPTWNPSVVRMSLNGPFVNGVTGLMETSGGRSHQVRIVDIEPGRSFRLETAVLPLTGFSFKCEVVPSSAGSSISQTLTISGPLAFVFSALAGERIAGTFEPILRGLAQHAEASEADLQVTCACGESFSAANEDELFRLTRAHADQVHPELVMSDEQLRQLVAAAQRAPRPA
jgi:hypothetical protein